MAKSRFVYRGNQRTGEDVARKASEGSKDFDSTIKSGIPTYKPKEGENCIRIMPSTWDEPDWDYTTFTHFSVGPDDASYLCLDKMKGEACPICDAKAKAEDKEEADQLSPRKGVICWIIDRDSEKTGPQVWRMPFTKVRNEIHMRSRDKKTGTPILVDDPEEGYDIVFTRSGTDTKTQYTGVEVLREASPLHDDPRIQQKWLDYISDHPLPDVLNFYDEEYIEKVLYGRAKPKAEEEGVEEAEPTSRASRLRRNPEPEPEEETEVPPSRSSRRPRATEPEPEEEEAEPETSTRSRRRALLDDPEEAETTPRRGRGEALEETSPVQSARRSLERLKTRSRASAAEPASTGRRPRRGADLDDDVPF